MGSVFNVLFLLYFSVGTSLENNSAMLPYYIFFVITSLAASPSTLPLTVNDDTQGLSMSVAKTEQESDITLTWLNQTTMHIVWPEKSTDIIIK